MNRESDPAHVFLKGLVDYAGLFPPAALDIPTAVAEYAAHRGEDEAWMMGRFIAPAARLKEICATAAAHGVTDLWEFSLLVGDGSGTEAALSAIEEQARTAQACEADHAIRVAALEAPLPAAATGAEAAGFGRCFLDGLTAAGLGGREIYLEVPAGSDDAATIASIKSLTDHDGFPRIGAKLRCGGVVPEAFPPVERVAAFILACRAVHLPLKCTAGLHHPVRHRSAEPDVMMHGFLNVFGAGVLVHGGLTDLESITACVAETDPTAFGFAEGSFRWRDHVAATDVVAAARNEFLAGFGSCSFAEPRADLKELGIL